MPQRHIPFRTTATACVLSALWLFAGCGSHHHDSTGPTPQTLGLTPGTYRGTQTLHASGGGQTVPAQSGPIVIVLGDDGTVQVGQYPATHLQGNAFSTTAPYTALNQQNPSLGCTSGNLTANGVFSGQTVSGDIFTTGFVCQGLALTVAGNYTAKLSASELPRGDSGADALDQARQLLERLLH
jgi:hypothetical protein